ncbi:hypothetical protein JGU66_25865 [Myxococcaceae bacterium JPH2]|nr:hypothetical protein [Myxococcaceae bacterium JPH2]
MAEKLGAILVRKGLITQAQLDEALNSQLIYGGRLGSHLVEMGWLDIDTLGMALGEQMRLPVAMEADFDVVPEAALKLLTAAQAEKHLAFPLAQEGRRLKVALASPLEIQHVDALGFITGLRIIPHVTPELRLFEYQLRRYGIQRPVRSSRPKAVSAARRPAAPLPVAPPGRPAAMAPVAPPASMPPAPVRAEPGAAAMFGGLAPGQFLSDDAEPVDAAAVQWGSETGDTAPLRGNGGALAPPEAMIDFTEDGEAQVAPPVLSAGPTGGPPVLSPLAGARPSSPPRLAPSEPPRAPVAPPPARPTAPMQPPGMQARTAGGHESAAPIAMGASPTGAAQPPGMQSRAGAQEFAAPIVTGVMPSGSTQPPGMQSRAAGAQDAAAPIVTGVMSSGTTQPPGMQSRVAGAQGPAAPIVTGATPSGSAQPPGMQSRAGGPPAGGVSRPSSPGMPAVSGPSAGEPPRRPSSPGLSPVGGEDRGAGMAQPPGMMARPTGAPPGTASTAGAPGGVIPPGMRTNAPSGSPPPGMAPKPVGPPPMASRPPGPAQGTPARPPGSPMAPGMSPGSMPPPGMARPSGPPMPPGEAGRVSGAPGMGARPAGPPVPSPEGVSSSMASRPGVPPTARPDSVHPNVGPGAPAHPVGPAMPSAPGAHASSPGSATRAGGPPMLAVDAAAQAAAPGNAPRPASPPMPPAEAAPAMAPRPGVTAMPPPIGAPLPGGVTRAPPGAPPGMAPRPQGPLDTGRGPPVQGSPVGVKPSTTLVPGQLTPQGMPASQGTGAFAGDAGVRPPTGPLPPGALRPVAQPVMGQVPQPQSRPVPSAGGAPSAAGLPPLEPGLRPSPSSTQPPSAFPPGALTAVTEAGMPPLAEPPRRMPEAVIPTPPLFVAGAESLSADASESESADPLALEPIEDIEAIDSDVLDIDVDSAPVVLAEPQESTREPGVELGSQRAVEHAPSPVDVQESRPSEGSSAPEESSTWASAFDAQPASPATESPVESPATPAPETPSLLAEAAADLVAAAPIEFSEAPGLDTVDAAPVPVSFTELSWGDAAASELMGVESLQPTPSSATEDGLAPTTHEDASLLDLSAVATEAEPVLVAATPSATIEEREPAFEQAPPSTAQVSEPAQSAMQTTEAHEAAPIVLDVAVSSHEDPQPVANLTAATPSNEATRVESLLTDSADAFELVAESGITPEPFGSTQDAKASSPAFAAEGAPRSEVGAPPSEEQWASVPLPAIAGEPDSKRSTAVEAASTDVPSALPASAELAALVGVDTPAGVEPQREDLALVDAETLERAAGDSPRDVMGVPESSTPEHAAVVAPVSVVRDADGTSSEGADGRVPEPVSTPQMDSTASPVELRQGEPNAAGHAGDTAASIALFEVELVSAEPTGDTAAPIGLLELDAEQGSAKGAPQVVHAPEPQAPVSAPDVRVTGDVAPARMEKSSDEGPARGTEPKPATPATESSSSLAVNETESATEAQLAPHTDPKSAQDPESKATAHDASLPTAARQNEAREVSAAQVPAHSASEPGPRLTEPESEAGSSSLQSQPARAGTLTEASPMPMPIAAVQDDAAGPSAPAWGLESAPSEPAPIPERRIRVPIELDDLGPASDEPMQLASTWEFVGWQGHGEPAKESSEPAWKGRAVELDAPASAAPEGDNVALASAWDFMQPWQPPADGNEAAMALLAAASASLETPTEGPAVSAEQLLAVLERVGTQGLVGKLLLAYSAGRFRRAFLLGESFGLARVGRAWGAGSESPQVAALSVDLESPSLFASALSSGAPRVFSAPDCPQDETIFAALCEPASHLLVAPLRVRGRPVAFFVAEHGPAPVDPELVAEVTRIAEKVTETYGRLQQHERAG